MATDRMYELAFQYKKTKLWKKLYDCEIFALKLSNGETGFCCVMGMAGQVNAVSLYLGDKGFQSYRNIAKERFPMYDYEAMLMSQDCLQCGFDSKDALHPRELDEVRIYTKKNGITLRGANAFPQFLKYQPYYHPWFVFSDVEQGYMCEALEACIAMAGFLQHKTKSEIGLSNPFETGQTIPCLIREAGSYVITHIDLPTEWRQEYPTPTLKNEFSIARLKQAKKKGIFECKIIRLPAAVQETEEDVPYYPAVLLSVNRTSELVYPTNPIRHLEENPESLLESFVEKLLENEICPRKMETNDVYTFEFLKNLCNAVGIQLVLTEKELPALEEAIDSLMSAMLFDEEEVDYDEDFDEESDMEAAFLFGALNMLAHMSDSDLRNMPKPLRQELLQLAEAGLLPPELERKIRRML